MTNNTKDEAVILDASEADVKPVSKTHGNVGSRAEDDDTAAWVKWSEQFQAGATTPDTQATRKLDQAEQKIG